MLRISEVHKEGNHMTIAVHSIIKLTWDLILTYNICGNHIWDSLNKVLCVDLYCYLRLFFPRSLIANT